MNIYDLICKCLRGQVDINAHKLIHGFCIYQYYWFENTITSDGRQTLDAAMPDTMEQRLATWMFQTIGEARAGAIAYPNLNHVISMNGHITVDGTDVDSIKTFLNICRDVPKKDLAGFKERNQLLYYFSFYAGLVDSMGIPTHEGENMLPKDVREINGVFVKWVNDNIFNDKGD